MTKQISSCSAITLWSWWVSVSESVILMSCTWLVETDVCLQGLFQIAIINLTMMQYTMHKYVIIFKVRKQVMNKGRCHQAEVILYVIAYHLASNQNIGIGK